MFCLKLFNKNIFCLYRHFIMSLNIKNSCDVDNSNSLLVEKISLDNYKQCVFGSFPISFMRKYLKEQSDYAKGFLFKNADGLCVGYIWVMLKGGQEVQYKIKNIDAFIFDVCVNKDFRRNGIGSYMMSYVINYLFEKKIKTCYLAVRMENTPAINLYKKLGFHIIRTCSFVRFCKRNIPYYSL